MAILDDEDDEAAAGEPTAGFALGFADRWRARVKTSVHF
jgi:hypothetical protein